MARAETAAPVEQAEKEEKELPVKMADCSADNVPVAEAATAVKVETAAITAWVCPL